ncbi:MAG: hypothetical protein KatS3mg035_1609 [Bacteroidia bacterium]|nr:MAG: hypothetical protein KatS3mg035_1609 [Bacteroidia bacterium]
MKKTLLLSLFITPFILFAQSSHDDVPVTCYQKYAKVFEERGASNAGDGVYDNVIISIRSGTNADCFNGKVTVKEGKVNPNDIYLKFEDGTYEQLKRAYKFDKPVSVVNGITETLVTKGDELINVMFVKLILPKKKSYERAPEPNFDF